MELFTGFVFTVDLMEARGGEPSPLRHLPSKQCVRPGGCWPLGEAAESLVSGQHPLQPAATGRCFVHSQASWPGRAGSLGVARQGGPGPQLQLHHVIRPQACIRLSS